MKKKLGIVLSILLVISFILTGCSNTSGSSSETTDAADTTEVTTATTNTDAAVAATILTSSEIVVDAEFTANDLEVGFEESSATYINFNGSSIEVTGNGASANENVLTISKEGSYVISGTLDDGQIIVDAEEGDKIQIVLDGVTINCTDNAPIYIKNADKVFITLAEGTVNTLTDGSEYVQNDENSVDGVIFSMVDLTINGKGTLNITGNYKHGIISKDDLTITGGTFNISAVKDAINGKDCVKIKDGILNLSAASGNGIQSKNGEDTATGYVYIYGGTITVTNCNEGIEGTAIIIEGGTIDITAQDDGFNASSGDTSVAASATATDTDATSDKNGMNPGNFGGMGAFENDANCYISISGGTITINALGDGIDSNGSLYVSGGTISVSGPTENMNGGLDYNGTADITGGSIIVTGSTGMAQGFSETSTQYSILNNLTTACAAGTEVTLSDADGKVIISYTPDKQYQSVVISTSELANGETYTLTCGDQTAEITLLSIVTSNGQSGMGFPSGGMGGKQGTRPDNGGMKKPGN